MKVTTVSVEVKKMLSDGDYGHESAQASFTVEVDASDGDPTGVMAVLMESAPAVCANQLAASESLTVRRKIKAPRRVCNECHLELDDDIRGYLHPACEEIARNNRDAERARQLAGVGADLDLENIPF